MAERDRDRKLTVGHERFREWCAETGKDNAAICQMLNRHIKKHRVKTSLFDKKNISRYKTGDRRPSAEKLVVLSEIAGIDPFLWSM